MGLHAGSTSAGAPLQNRSIGRFYPSSGMGSECSNLTTRQGLGRAKQQIIHVRTRTRAHIPVHTRHTHNDAYTHVQGGMLVSLPAAGRCNSSQFQTQLPDGLKGVSRVENTGRVYSSQYPIQLPDGLSPFASPIPATSSPFRSALISSLCNFYAVFITNHLGSRFWAIRWCTPCLCLCVCR